MRIKIPAAATISVLSTEVPRRRIGLRSTMSTGPTASATALTTAGSSTFSANSRGSQVTAMDTLIAVTSYGCVRSGRSVAQPRLMPSGTKNTRAARVKEMAPIAIGSSDCSWWPAYTSTDADKNA